MNFVAKKIATSKPPGPGSHKVSPSPLPRLVQPAADFLGYGKDEDENVLSHFVNFMKKSAMKANDGTIFCCCFFCEF